MLFATALTNESIADALAMPAYQHLYVALAREILAVAAARAVRPEAFDGLAAPGKPTLLVYGHYDVQPADPLEKWHSSPWTPTVRDGRLYARGVSDDKGPMLIPIAVAEAFFATAGCLPVNVKFMFEGEEEIGSRHLDAFVQQHKELLAADVVVSADGAMWRIDEPSLTMASRGLCGLERQWTRPTLEVNGMWGGYQGPGQKTVIPCEAHAKITCRLVPDQHPDEVAARMRRHLACKAASAARNAKWSSLMCTARDPWSASDSDRRVPWARYWEILGGASA